MKKFIVVGLAIEAAAFILTILLIIFQQPIFDWVFISFLFGTMLVFVGAFIFNAKTKRAGLDEKETKHIHKVQIVTAFLIAAVLTAVVFKSCSAG